MFITKILKLSLSGSWYTHTYSLLSCDTDTDVNVNLEHTEYFVDEGEGYVEICAVMTTSCSECSLLNVDITLSITPDTATGKLHALGA